MTLEERSKAKALARELFPADVHDGADCRDEAGREGEPCRVCADLAREWDATVWRVYEALIKTELM